MVTAAFHPVPPNHGTPPRLGHFAVPPLTQQPATDYRAIIDLARRAELEGFDSFWVAEGRIATNGLPSALTFLAALSQQTQTLTLGTAVITLAFEDPISLAETAAVVDALSEGRLQLGLGKSNRGGWATPAFEALSLHERDRDALFTASLVRFRAALGGESEGREFTIHPPASHLRGRLWQATGSISTAAAAGVAGDGLQLHRKSPEGDTGEVQSRLIDAYLERLPDEADPRIGASRVVLPARDRADAVALYREQISARPDHYRRVDRAADLEQHLVESNVAYGSVADIAGILARDAAARRATDLLFSIPLPFDVPEYGDGLATVAHRLAPLLATRERLTARPVHA